MMINYFYLTPPFTSTRISLPDFNTTTTFSSNDDSVGEEPTTNNNKQDEEETTAAGGTARSPLQHEIKD